MPDFDDDRHDRHDPPAPPADGTGTPTGSIELVRRAQAGDGSALDSLFERYYVRVRKIVRLRLGPKLRAKLESLDITQDTFYQAVRAFDRFEMRDESSLINWLSRIAENQVKAAADYHDALKRDAARVPTPLGPGQDSEDAGLDVPDEGKPTLDALVDDEDVTAIESCMDELREEYREVIVHRDYAGASWERIAAWIGVPTADAARMRYARAVADLSHLVRKRQGS